MRCGKTTKNKRYTTNNIKKVSYHILQLLQSLLRSSAFIDFRRNEEIKSRAKRVRRQAMDVWDVQSRFKIQDGSKVRRLMVRIKKGVNLMAVKFGGQSDAFVAIRTLDSKEWHRTAYVERVLHQILLLPVLTHLSTF